jgi:hypothetical protein
LLALLLGLLLALVPARAAAQPAGSLGARDHVVAARREGSYTFCSKPRLPLQEPQRELCGLAAEVEGCEAFVAACTGEVVPDKKPDSRSAWQAVVEALAALAKVLVWLLVLLVIVAIAAPLVLALLRARRDKAIADAPRVANVATSAERVKPPEPETISDAEAALREADDHARRGELARALSLYLAASLAALERRGAIRLARHRTNGEYVRACATDPSCWPLRDIVREVDRVEFGKVPPTVESVGHVAARATSLVRGGAGGASGAVSRAAASITTGLVVLLAVLSMGCGGRRALAGDDPAGDELPMEVLRRSGYSVAYLSRSLSALPLPESGSGHAPVVVVDVERVPLEEESAAHMLRWVNEGGVLVLFGSPLAWPDALKATPEHADNDSVDVLTSEVYARGARVGSRHALTWSGSEPVAFIGGKGVYAAHKNEGHGVIVGIASHELFTNVGVARPDNAGALAALLDVAMADRAESEQLRGIAEPATTFEVVVARREDGIPPPSNPFSALVQAGLGRGAWHALAAALVLFLAFGTRHARARPATPPARRAFAEHVEATGAFYGRARALGHALASYGRFAEMRLRERLPRGADPAQFLAARAKVSPEDAARVWRRATEAKADDPPRGDELATIRDLGAMLASSLDAHAHPHPQAAPHAAPRSSEKDAR